MPLNSIFLIRVVENSYSEFKMIFFDVLEI